MGGTLFRHLSLLGRLILSPRISNPYSTARYNVPRISSSVLPTFNLRFFSSKADSSVENPLPVPETNSANDTEDVSIEELKRRIEKYNEGDADAIPDIFEAILRRKLTGKHDESDDELMEEICREPLANISDKDDDSD
ncbi:hypothetical protein NMG60_11020678 [Bertholletia excelsa]